jgi:uncharacterized SAM-binding protein YcdF (DUF218 family)
MARREPLRPAVAAGVLGLTGFLALAYTPLTGALARRLAPMSDPAPADAIVVLGAGAGPDGQLSDPSLRRFVGGLLLYRRGLAPRVILMGPGYGGGPVEARIRATLAVDLGIPAGALVVEGRGLTTRHEAVLAAERMRELGGRRVLLVTGAPHMPRARRLFERAGLEVVPAPVVEVSADAERPDARLAMAQVLVQEALARWYYRVAGYL